MRRLVQVLAPVALLALAPAAAPQPDAGRAPARQAPARSPVDPALVGTWRHAFTNPATDTPEEWVLELSADGEYRFTRTRRLPEGPVERTERGRFEARAGRYAWTASREVVRGRYRFVRPDAVELAGLLGSVVWERVDAGRTAGPVEGAGPPASRSDDPAATPEAVGRLLYEESFREDRRWREGLEGSCRKAYADGGYAIQHVGAAGFCETVVVGAGALPARVRIEVAVRLRRGPLDHAFGLEFGSETAGSRSPYFTFVLSGDGSYRLARWDGTRRRTLIDWTADPAVATGLGATNRLGVEVDGRTIRVFVNGKALGTVQADAEVRGYAGLYLGQRGLEVVFNDFRVTELPAPPAGVNGRVRFEDDFRTRRRWTPGTFASCAVRYADGGFLVEHVGAQGTCEHVFFAAGPLEGSRRVELEVRLRRGRLQDVYGLLFGLPQGGAIEFYTLAVSGDGYYRLGRSTAGERTLLVGWRPDPAIAQGIGATNRLTVEIHDRTIRFGVNGRRLGAVRAPAAIAGHVGVYLGEPGVEVLLTELRILD